MHERVRMQIGSQETVRARLTGYRLNFRKQFCVLIRYDCPQRATRLPI